jgi:hypothetical protein
MPFIALNGPLERVVVKVFRNDWFFDFTKCKPCNNQP